jgi:hypothetical protein
VKSANAAGYHEIDHRDACVQESHRDGVEDRADDGAEERLEENQKERV